MILKKSYWITDMGKLDNYFCDGQLNIFDYIHEKELVYPLEIKGLMDDGYCPKCNYLFGYNETDLERCPKCGIKVDWSRWHRINDEEG